MTQLEITKISLPSIATKFDLLNNLKNCSNLTVMDFYLILVKWLPEGAALEEVDDTGAVVEVIEAEVDPDPLKSLVKTPLLLGLLWWLLECLTLLLRLTLFSDEVSLDTVRLGTCGAEAILLWLLDWEGLAGSGSTWPNANKRMKFQFHVVKIS